MFLSLRNGLKKVWLIKMPQKIRSKMGLIRKLNAFNLSSTMSGANCEFSRVIKLWDNGVPHAFPFPMFAEHHVHPMYLNYLFTKNCGGIPIKKMVDSSLLAKTDDTIMVPFQHYLISLIGDPSQNPANSKLKAPWDSVNGYIQPT